MLAAGWFQTGGGAVPAVGVPRALAASSPPPMAARGWGSPHLTGMSVEAWSLPSPVLGLWLEQ